MARVFTFRRTLVQTRKRGHTATGAACYRLGLAAESRFTGTDGALRQFDFTKRRGIGVNGCALPEGAADAWRDPLEWARRIEAVDYRSNSRQFRDDVIGIPRELMVEGKAEQTIAAYAQRIAAKWRTPVHFVIHDEHGKNPHAHVMYAGRAVKGEQFAKHRDREQDQRGDPKRGQQSITELHSQFWIETLREIGHEASFEPVAENGEAQDHIGPKAWAREQKAIQNETAERITKALDPEQPIDAGDALKIAHAATADLTVTEALALDRDPVTLEMVEARKPIRETALAVALERPNVEATAVVLEPPRRDAAPAVDLPQALTPRAVRTVALEPPQRDAAPAVVLPPALSPRAVVVALDPPQRSAALRIEHEVPIPTAAPTIALEPPQRDAAPAIDLPQALTPRAVPAVALASPQRRAAARIKHEAPIPTAAPTIALAPPQRRAAARIEHEAPVPTAAPTIALAPPQRRAAARIEHEAPVPTAAPTIALAPPQRDAAARIEHEAPSPTAAPTVRLQIPKHIAEHRRLKEAQKWEAEQRKQREKAARSRLTSAITVDTAAAAVEDLIENHAGNASAYASFIQHGIGSQTSSAAVDQLRPIAERHQVAERDRRTKARTDRQYLDAVKRAIGGFRRWWRTGGMFRSAGAGESIVEQVIATVWPTHVQETEQQHTRITRELEEKRERERQRQAKALGINQYRPQLVETGKGKTKRPGGPGPGDGGGFER